MENLHLPIDYLMPEIKELILSIEEKMNCPRDFATTAVFAIASGAIGNRIQTNDGVYKIAKKKIEEKDDDTYMSDVRDKLFVYSQKWAGLDNILHGDCIPFGLSKHDYRFVDGKPCESVISGEAMEYAIDCMNVFEHWAERVLGKIAETNTTKITLADAIRVINDFYPISNKSQFAQSCGMTRELLYKYLPKIKEATPSK